VVEKAKQTIIELENELTNKLNQSMHVNKNERELRQKIDELNANIFRHEATIRDNKEQMYLVSTENSNLKSDLKNLSQLELALRAEINNLMQQRQELENTLQMVKSKISQDSLSLRKLETQNEALNRQIMSMENTINIATKEVDDMRAESDYMKENLNNKEKENIILKKTLEKKESDLQSSKTALSRANSLLDAHQNNNEFYETTERRKEELKPSMTYTPDYNPQKKSLLTSSLQTFISPYDSPLITFKRQEVPKSAYFNPALTFRVEPKPYPVTPLMTQGTKGETFTADFDDMSKFLQL
jgi:chromosome segregation ATPase